MDFKSQFTSDPSFHQPGPKASTTHELFNGGLRHSEDNNSQENTFSTDLSKIGFDSTLEDDDENLCLSSSRINRKSKSNPLLDRLLDKPMGTGDLGIFGYSGNYGDSLPPDEPAQSFMPDEHNSFIDLCMETPFPTSKAQNGSEGTSDAELKGKFEKGQNGDEENSGSEGDSDSDEEDDSEEEDEDPGEEGEEKETSNSKPEPEENGDEEKQNDDQPDDAPLKEEDIKSDPTRSPEQSETESKPKKGKGKGKGVKRKTDKSSSKEGKKKARKTYMMRKNIKKIISDDDVNAETLKAQAEEAERLKRVEERAALMKQQNQHLIQNSQEDVMILSSDDEIITPSHSGFGMKNNDSDADIIEIASDEFSSDDDRFPPNAHNNSTISVCSSSGNRSARKDPHRKRKGGEEEYIDTNNDGAHTDDRFNQPDEEGRVLVNVGHPSDEKPIYLASQLSRAVKPHQIGGIRFLYDNIVDNLRRHRNTDGLGCILAHSMGLGKTFQLISFIDVYLTHTQSKHVLCIVPINTLQNWMAEFDLWLPSKKVSAFKPDSNEIKFREFDVFMLNECKTLTSRSKEIIAWRKAGGVLLIGYEMYRLLTTDVKTARGRKAKTKEIEELPQEVYDNLMTQIREALVNPGPDLVICDEGHRIKNCNAATSLALKEIRTRRRVVLTGYPLQNNLIEYWCMVDFVRPSFLGTKQEFCNMFERPISNGQCADSTDNDKKTMKARAHVLHKLLRGFVQRRSHSILTGSLPRKHEHVVLVRMTPIQKKLMLAFLDRIKSDTDNSHRLNPIMLFSVFCKVWNHPDILYKIVKEGQNFDDLDIDLDGGKTKTVRKTGNKKKGKTKKPNKRGGKNAATYSDDEDSDKTLTNKNGNKNGSYFLGSDSFTSSNDFHEGTNGGSSTLSSNSYHQPNSSHSSSSYNSFASRNSNNYGSTHNNNHSSSSSNNFSSSEASNSRNVNLQQPNSSNNSTYNFQSNEWTGNQDISSLIADYSNLDGPSTSAPSLPGHYPNRMMDYTWAEPLVTQYKPGMLQNGLKMLLFFEMVEHTIQKGDKLLVFSHSLFTLDIIEKFLSQRKVPKRKKSRPKSEFDEDDYEEAQKWCRGSNYFRIDGSTSASDREKLINTFNKDKNVHLFLLSTRAGCLGINLIGANRIIVFDASWNPCHDAQAACRIYRYGQQKECFIYRLICDESLEKRIYDRQITKQEVSCRVVDELNPETNFTRREIDSLIEDLDQINLSDVKTYTQEECDAYEDDIIQHICKNMSHCLSKPPFEHESLLLDHKETKLSYQEKKSAEEAYYRAKHELSKSNANGAKHSAYIASVNNLAANNGNTTTNLPANMPNNIANFNAYLPDGVPMDAFSSINVPITPPKPTLGRPTKYPSVGMLPPSALKPGTYPAFGNPMWNASLAQSRNLTGQQYFQQNNNPSGDNQANYQQVPSSSSSQPTNWSVKSTLSHNNIINQFNNLPPEAFIEQLSRHGFFVRRSINNQTMEITPQVAGRERIVIPQGQDVFFIRSPQNECYFRTIDGRIFSIKPNGPANYVDPLGTQSTPLASNVFRKTNNQTSTCRNLPSTSNGQPEVICLDDD